MLFLPNLVLEHTSGYYTFTLVDETGAGVADTVLNTMTLTYYDQDMQAILNGRENQDCLNTNDVLLETVYTPEVLTTVAWDIQPLDAVIVHPTRTWEVHVAIFRWTWDASRREGVHEVSFGVEHLLFVPA